MELDLDKFMPVDEIKTGMKGIGKTVFEGTRIDEFQVEILSIEKNGNGPKSDIIWALCTGGPLEETGILQGMSGSPIYINDRLIGAVAYVFSFAKKPIAGVTPIADMLNIFEDEQKASSVGHARLNYGLFPEQADSMFYREQIDKMLHEGQSEIPIPTAMGSTISPLPIQMPVMMSGFHPRAIDDMAPMLKEFGMVPVQGGGASSGVDSEDIPFEPGAIFCIQLVRGDMGATASGTVTYVDGNRVLAFGHPMSGRGKVSLPISSGRGGLVIPNLLISSKRASPAKTIGSLVYDSAYGVMGVIGKEPEFIPMKVRINSEEFNFEIARHRVFAPSYIYSIALNVIYSVEKTSGDYTMRMHTEISLNGHPDILKDNVFSGTSPLYAATEFSMPFYLLMQNNFEEADVENILLEIEFDDKRSNARIDGIQVNKSEVKPGDSVEVMLSITPYMENTVIRQFGVTIPEDMPEGTAFLRISDAASSKSWERSRAPMKARIIDMPHLIRSIQEEESNDDIIVELYISRIGFVIRDQELPALPLTTFSVMNSRKLQGRRGFTRGTTFMKKRIKTEYVLSGSTMMLLNIDRDAP